MQRRRLVRSVFKQVRAPIQRSSTNNAPIAIDTHRTEKSICPDGRDDSPHGPQDRFAQLREQAHAGRVAARRHEARQPVEQQREQIDVQRQVDECDDGDAQEGQPVADARAFEAEEGRGACRGDGDDRDHCRRVHLGDGRQHAPQR